MSRIETVFKALNRPALVTFITAGDPDFDKSLNILKALPGAGADIIELGMPFTDPMADGPVIQAAGLRALENGANMKQTLKMAAAFRKENDKTPLVLMGYANPVYAYGVEKFVKDAAAAGVDGLIIVDLPPEESAELKNAAQEKGLDFIRLVTPTTDSARLPVVLNDASGFIYYVYVTGITGAAKPDPAALKPHINEIRKHTKLPIAIGFGIKNAADVKALSSIADAVVVGSAIVQNIAENQNNSALTSAITKQVSSLSKGL
ncbi:MAG: tryptophan synthase subunit alpha [Alphaproteobacteria bacterium]|nr:tryptophan synthase subunit alpha [Alphaproteobacteria bacterium]